MTDDSKYPALAAGNSRLSVIIPAAHHKMSHKPPHTTAMASEPNTTAENNAADTMCYKTLSSYFYQMVRRMRTQSSLTKYETDELIVFTHNFNQAQYTQQDLLSIGCQAIIMPHML